MAERRLFDRLQEVHRAFCEEREAQRSDVLKLRAAHEQLSAEVAALCRCLRKRGGLGEEQLQAELHRTRFEEAKRRSHWAPNGDALWTVLEVVGASRTAALAGGEAACALRAASEALRRRSTFGVGGVPRPRRRGVAPRPADAGAAPMPRGRSARRPPLHPRGDWRALAPQRLPGACPELRGALRCGDRLVGGCGAHGPGQVPLLCSGGLWRAAGCRRRGGAR
mmetsp:Transcript_59268/g.176311  ORF Transcript_59268/g.176311 Transcript_59268/m.176311 type:complete len:223 (+) Transcript_59268:45-713(+)